MSSNPLTEMIFKATTDYRSQFNHYDHVLVPAGRFNTFLVVVVDRVHGSVYGHRVLDLGAEYGSNEAQTQKT
jgi:hypothetical protein